MARQILPILKVYNKSYTLGRKVRLAGGRKSGSAVVKKAENRQQRTTGQKKGNPCEASSKQKEQFIGFYFRLASRCDSC